MHTWIPSRVTKVAEKNILVVNVKKKNYTQHTIQIEKREQLLWKIQRIVSENHKKKELQNGMR